MNLWQDIVVHETENEKFCIPNCPLMDLAGMECKKKKCCKKYKKHKRCKSCPKG